jgi:hypothetical protein
MPQDKESSKIERLTPQASAENKTETPSVPEGSFEAPKTPETKFEAYTIPEAPSMQKEGKQGESGGIVSLSNAQVKYEQRRKSIENVLAKDLDDVFMSMPPKQRLEFKVEGEETARKINAMLDDAKIKIKKIIVLIRKWLSMVPGVNKFFLEQEVKIKTDEILRMKDLK